MSKRSERSFIKRLAIDAAGFGLIVLSPFLGTLPGPGGIPIFLAGVAILSRNYDWAENLLKDFEKKRLEFVDKYLVGNRRISLVIDGICLLMIILGIFLVIKADSFILKGISVGLLSLSVFIIVSNQRRIDRFLRKLKASKHKH